MRFYYYYFFNFLTIFRGQNFSSDTVHVRHALPISRTTLFGLRRDTRPFSESIRTPAIVYSTHMDIRNRRFRFCITAAALHADQRRFGVYRRSPLITHADTRVCISCSTHPTRSPYIRRLRTFRVKVDRDRKANGSHGTRSKRTFTIIHNTRIRHALGATGVGVFRLLWFVPPGRTSSRTIGLGSRSRPAAADTRTHRVRERTRYSGTEMPPRPGHAEYFKRLLFFIHTPSRKFVNF